MTVGFLFASIGTKMTYDCAPIDGFMGCVSFEKAIMHPADLLNNRQNSLVKFTANFAAASLITFALLSIVSLAQRGQSKHHLHNQTQGR